MNSSHLYKIIYEGINIVKKAKGAKVKVFFKDLMWHASLNICNFHIQFTIVY
jgi:hypothetical protein